MRAERPFPPEYCKFLNAVAGPTDPAAGTRLEQLQAGRFMGVELTLQEPEEWDEEVQGEYDASHSLKDLGHQTADYCDALQHFFHARISSDTHHIMPRMKKCMNLRKFALPLHRPYASLESTCR